jgi:hypothetical protein
LGRLGDLMQPGGNQLRGQSAFAMLHPALGDRLDYPDVAGLAAPRPMPFLSGGDDRHFPADVAERAFGDLRRIWQAAGAGPVLHTEIVDGAHVFGLGQQAPAGAFLERALAPAAGGRETERDRSRGGRHRRGPGVCGLDQRGVASTRHPGGRLLAARTALIRSTSSAAGPVLSQA